MHSLNIRILWHGVDKVRPSIVLIVCNRCSVHDFRILVLPLAVCYQDQYLVSTIYSLMDHMNCTPLSAAFQRLTQLQLPLHQFCLLEYVLLHLGLLR